MLVAAWASSAVGASSVADAALVPAPESRSRTKGPKEVVCSKRPKLLIISAGGIGTTTAISEFHKIPELEANCPSDSDGLKHLPYNRLVADHGKQLTDVTRILYLWGNPMHAVASLYRRGYQVTQAMKTRSEPFPDGSLSKTASERAVPRTIDAYAASKYDIFQMQKHIESYLTNRNDTSFKPALAFLQMERKTEHLDKLAHFLGVPRLALKNHMSSWETACRAELADEETRLQGDMHQRSGASNDTGSASATAVREVVLAAEAVPSITYLPRGDGSSSRSYHAKAEYDKWKQGRAEQGKGATAPQREEVPEVRVTHPNPKPEEDEEPTSFWAKAQRVLKRIGEAMGGNDGGSSALGRAIGGSNNSTSQNSTPHGLTSFEDVPPKSSTPKQQRTAHKRTEKNATTAQNKTVTNSTTAQQAGSLREVAADRGCQPREVAADSLSVELQARLNSKFEALSAITAGLEGDGFWVQHRPEEWVYGVDYV